MAGFSGIADLYTKMIDEGKRIEFPFIKSASPPESSSVALSLWNVGSLPAAGGNPATTPGAAYTNAGISFKDTSSLTKHLIHMSATIGGGANSSGNLVLYDRLVGVGGIDLTSTGDKTVSSAALTRYTSGMGVQAWLEVSTATTTTAPIVTLNSYTDEDGNTGQAGTAVTFPATATNVDVMVQLPLGTDQGVRAVSTLNVGTAAAVGAANLILLYPLAWIPIAISTITSVLYVLNILNPVRIFDGASLGFLYHPLGSGTPLVIGNVEVAYG